MRKYNRLQQSSLEIQRLRKQVRTLKLLLWEILAGPKLISETELNSLRDKAAPVLMEDPVPKKLEDLTNGGNTR